jgi:hypothetical protein
MTLTKSHHKTASATAAAASHHELCMMAMAIKPVKKKNKEQEPAFTFACLGNQRQQPFFSIGEIKKIENRKSSDFGVLQSLKVRMPEYDLLIKLFTRFLCLVFRV